MVADVLVLVFSVAVFFSARCALVSAFFADGVFAASGVFGIVNFPSVGGVLVMVPVVFSLLFSRGIFDGGGLVPMFCGRNLVAVLVPFCVSVLVVVFWASSFIPSLLCFVSRVSIISFIPHGYCC